MTLTVERQVCPDTPPLLGGRRRGKSLWDSARPSHSDSAHPQSSKPLGSVRVCSTPFFSPVFSILLLCRSISQLIRQQGILQGCPLPEKCCTRRKVGNYSLPERSHSVWW